MTLELKQALTFAITDMELDEDDQSYEDLATALEKLRGFDERVGISGMGITYCELGEKLLSLKIYIISHEDFAEDIDPLGVAKEFCKRLGINKICFDESTWSPVVNHTETIRFIFLSWN